MVWTCGPPTAMRTPWAMTSPLTSKLSPGGADRVEISMTASRRWSSDSDVGQPSAGSVVAVRLPC
jgi:hypothetical protein